jgi:class 3 adenylate cyclase/pimeloyl-ACP methyl ester carboxylesterase
VVGIPETRYTKSGDVHIAYQVFGSGPPDLVMVPGGFSHLDLHWDEPDLAAQSRALARFCRVIKLDKRGAGLSDRVAVLPPYEDQVDDVLAVMDAVDTERPVVHGFLDGGVLAALLAAIHPGRCGGLILDACVARVLVAPDYPWGFDPEVWEQVARQVDEEWFLDDLIELIAPYRRGDEAYRDWFKRYARAGAGPGGLAAIMRLAAQVDIRDVLPAINVPTLVIARQGNALATVESARFLAENIPGAHLVVIDYSSRRIGRGIEPILREIEEFVTGTRGVRTVNRALATVLFTDIVASTVRLTELGDSAWRELLDRHDDLARRHVAQFGGRLVGSTGDGVFATFDGPARAIHCAQAFVSAARKLGIDVRAGLHTGEVEVRGEDIGGIAVHIAARVAARADAGEVLVSRTVTDLVAGSGLEFDDQGQHELKGVPGNWRIYSVRN